MTRQETATEALKYFETKTRDDGSQYVSYDYETTPQWIKDMVYSAHEDGEYLPDDYRYSWIQEALSDFADANEDSDEDNIYEFVDSAVDCYTSGLTAWLNSDNRRVYYLTQAIEEQDCKDGFQLLSMAQFEEIKEVYYAVYHSLDEQSELVEV